MKSAGMEVPIPGGDSIKWIQVTVPPPPSSSSAATTLIASCSRDYASCSVIGDPPLYFIWRIHEASPNALELLQLSAHAEFPTTALRLSFPFPLSPFAFFFNDQASNTSTTFYHLYALTVTGVVYCLRISHVSAYASCSIFPQDHLFHLDLQAYSDHAPVTSVAALPGCLVLGRSDGSVSCFQLGMSHETGPDFFHELRDDSGFGRLWGFVSSRGRMVGAVQDLVISQFHGRKLVFVLHADGVLRLWDLSSFSRIFTHNIAVSTLEGFTFSRLCLGEADCDSGIIPLAVLYKSTMDVNLNMINVYGLRLSSGDRLTLSVDSAVQNIPLEEGELRDVKFSSDKLWVLKDNGLLSYMYFRTKVDMEAHCYALQEEFVSDQLFQSSECHSDALILITNSLFASAKEQIVPFVSSIFLRRLLCPGVFNSIALRLTLLEYHKHWSDPDFQSLSIDELKNEILSLVEYEVVSESSNSVFHWWRNFCGRYLHHWYNNNKAYGLLVESSAAVVGLIRNNSVSLLRGLENIEHVISGSSSEFDNLVSGLVSHEEREILVEVVGFINKIGKQLGKATYAIFHESFIGKPIVSSEEIVPRFLKVLESGFVLSIRQHTSLELGADVAWEKELEEHKNLRKFSIDMLLSLSALFQRAGSWEKVLTVIRRYLQCLVPKKCMQNNHAETISSVCCSILVQATSQVAKVMFESAVNVLLFLSYLVNIAGQINMLEDDICCLQLELVPMIQDIVSEWLVVLFLVTTPAESTSIEDFSSQLSSLQINSNINRRSWNTKLGKCDFSLAYILFLSSQSCIEENHLSLRRFLSPQKVTSLVRNFVSWIVFSKTEKESSSLLRRSTEIAFILLRNGQSDAVQCLLVVVEASLRREKTFGRIQDPSGDWCLLQHLQGCCLIDQVQRGSRGISRERKISEAIRCFFRAASGEGAAHAFHSFFAEAGLPHFRFNGAVSSAAWKLHYYEWAMQMFERSNISEGACQFAFAALEQVDEAPILQDHSYGEDSLIESATAISGRLWANVFKFNLDLNLLNDAYCAIISNPDEEIKHVCLRRFIIVLFERSRIKILNDGQLPFIGLTEKIGQELAWKAERSDILTKPNPYKLLYAFEMYQHNWRMAATYMYQYSARLRAEPAFKDYKHLSLVLHERLNALSTAINALCLVHPAYAWIDPLPVEASCQNSCYPVKKARMAEKEEFSKDSQPKRQQCYTDMEKLQKEFVLTSTEYLLSLKNIRWTFSGDEKDPSDLVDLLIQTNLIDIAFTVILTFWGGSSLKRQLEKVFAAMAIKCCPSKVDSLSAGNDLRRNHLVLTSSGEEVIQGSPDSIPAAQNSKAAGEWENLEFYLEKYRDIHARLPITVAETLLRANPQIELPLWLVHMFKEGQKEKISGMTGQESSPASLIQLYVDHGRLTEATNLLLEYLELYASVKPADLVKRKKPFAVWFPYTAIERLWCQLEKWISSGYMVDQCEKLKGLLHRALLNHLKLLKVDSDDAVSAAVGR